MEESSWCRQLETISGGSFRFFCGRVTTSTIRTAEDQLRFPLLLSEDARRWLASSSPGEPMSIEKTDWSVNQRLWAQPKWDSSELSQFLP